MDYVITSRQVPEQPILSIRSQMPQSDLPGFLGRSFGELFGRLGHLGVQSSGPPFVIYHEFGPGRVDAEVCVPVAHEVTSTGRLTSRLLKAETVATTLHVGPYERLGDAYAALTSWIGDHRYEPAGPVRERYPVGIQDQVPPDEYRTEIEMPIAATSVQATV